MTMRYRKHHAWRGGGSIRTWLLLGLLILCALGAGAWPWVHRPSAAPADIQESGRRIIATELANLNHTGFGASERGRCLLAEAESLLRQNRIVFSAGLGERRGVTWSGWWGPSVVFIRVIEMNNGRYLHQLPSQVVESLFHEALHSVKGTLSSACFEEECDAFTAGLSAEYASRGLEPPGVLRIDGTSIAAFVEASYPNARRDRDYRPVGAPLEWLCRQAGMNP